MINYQKTFQKIYNWVAVGKMDTAYQNLPKDAIAIASYPRSGNTWMRKVISDIILQGHGYQTQTTLDIHPDQIIPDIHVSLERDQKLTLHYFYFKTHDAFEQHQRKSVYVFRQAEDSLTSYYHFHLRYPTLRGKAKALGIDDFCLEYLSAWIAHLQSYYQQSARNKADILFISYENMHRDGLKTLKKVTDFLEISADETMILKALENHSFQKLNSNEKLEPHHEGNKFFRRGKVGSGKDELSPKVLEVISSKSKIIYEKLDNSV